MYERRTGNPAARTTPSSYQCPLRKIVAEWYSQDQACLVERLECGHDQPAKAPGGYALEAASHRRCVACGRSGVVSPPPTPRQRPRAAPRPRVTQPAVERPCAECGTPFVSGPKQRFCSTRCRWREWERNKQGRAQTEP